MLASPTEHVAVLPDDPAGGTARPGHPVPVVAIGFSAGGLNSMCRFFDATPPGQGIAYVVVAHHHPQTPSLMPLILRRHTSMPVVAIESGMEVAPDRVHVVPPGAGAVLVRGRFQLDGERVRGRLVNPIDACFRSIARERGRWAVGVVLSGSGRDGSAGVMEIRRAGGLTIAQDEASAAFPEMPREAVATGAIDRVLPVDECASATIAHLEAAGRAPSVALSPGAGDEPAVARIIERVREVTGRNLSVYKPAVIRRRIAARMRVRDVRSLSAYAAGLEAFPDEAEALARAVLVSVTSFFRDPDAFDALAGVVDQLVMEKSQGALLRVWIAGCARGQEAISVAILFREAMERSGRFLPIRIVATDADPEAIAAAQSGAYRDRELAGISPERRDRFFSPLAGGARVHPDILDLVTFEVLGITDPPPLSDLDLITFRNVLIYLGDAAQSAVLAAMAGALRSRGVIVLGRAESLGLLERQFDVIDDRWRIYRRHGGGTPRAGSPLASLSTSAGVPLPVVVDERAADFQELSIANQELRSMVDELRARNQELEGAFAELTRREARPPPDP